MLRNVPTYLLMATVVASGSALAAKTEDQAAAAKTTSQPAAKPAAGTAAKPAATAAAKPAPAAAGVPVKPADVAPLMGTWEIPLDTPTGRLVAKLVFRLDAGKVVAGVSAPNFPEHKITDITKSGQTVTLKASTDYSGPLASYSGPVTMVLTLKPKGADQAAWFDFNNSGFTIGATAKKKA
jgi:hypothetical protein